MTAYVDLIRPKAKPLVSNTLFVLAGALFLALMSQIRVPLGFSPVPLSMQSFAVLLIGALLGSKRGALAVMTYLGAGALGLPVFAAGGAALAGYFAGFVVCAYLVGFLLERGWKESYALTLLALVLGEVAILSLGTLWLSFYVGGENALALGVYPFLVGDALKIGAAAALIPTGWKLRSL